MDGRTATLLFVAVLVLASCASPTYNKPAFQIECTEAGGLSLMVQYEDELKAGCSGLRNALYSMNCGQTGADDSKRDVPA
jgi:hypothetical protein